MECTSNYYKNLNDSVHRDLCVVQNKSFYFIVSNVSGMQLSLQFYIEHFFARACKIIHGSPFSQLYFPLAARI